MPNISKLNVQGTAYNLRDAASMHYIGHATEGITESSGVYTSKGLTGISVDIAVNDFITYGASNLNYVCTNVDTSATPATQTWVLISEAAAEIPVQDVTVAGTTVLDTSDHTAKIVVATSSTAATPKFGVVQTGANITNTDGVISVADADDNTKGVVQLSTAIPATGAVDTKAATEKAVADAIDAIPVKDVTVNGTTVVSNQTAAITINAATIAIDGTDTSKNALPNGVTATTQATSDDSTKIATTAYVHDLFDDIANPMIFKGAATIAADGSVTVTDPASPSDIKKGYTYKIGTVTTGYTGDLKSGDTIIANDDDPDVSSVGSDWTVVPSGDENDGTVMSVAASAAEDSNLVVTVEDTTTHSTSAITEAGSITVGIADGYQLLSNADKAKVDTIGTQAAVYNSVTASQTAAQDNSVAPARVGTNTGVDDDTLYIDFLNFGTAAVVGKATNS